MAHANIACVIIGPRQSSSRRDRRNGHPDCRCVPILIVALHNLSSHKLPAISEAIEAADARLFYLPPYLPDFNPIEQLFAKLKAALRKAAERSVESLWNRIAILLDIFPPDECANYFRNSGYASH